MGIFGKIGGALKSVGHGIGNVLSNPITKTIGTGLLAATGVGAPLAAAIGAGSGLLGGALKSGGGLKSALGQGAMGGALGAGAGMLGGTGIMGKLGVALKKGGSSVLGQAGSGLKNYFTNPKGGLDFGNLAKAGLGVAGAVGQRQASNARNKYNDAVIGNQNKALDMAMNRFNEGSELRKAANSRLASLLSKPQSGDVFRPYLNR